MSIIDSYDHAHVAQFFDLPIYWVLEETTQADLTGRDEPLNMNYLCIGGGGGEHPALVVNNDAVVSRLLNEINLGTGGNSDRPIIDQNDWPLESFIRIADKFNKSKIQLTDKIIYAIALFIIYEMPLEYCLKDSKLVEASKMILNGVPLSNDISACWDAINGVLECQKVGRLTRNGNVIWGYGLNDWRNEFLKKDNT
jgi:hypothetical protein